MKNLNTVCEIKVRYFRVACGHNIIEVWSRPTAELSELSRDSVFYANTTAGLCVDCERRRWCKRVSCERWVESESRDKMAVSGGSYAAQRVSSQLRRFRFANCRFHISREQARSARARAGDCCRACVRCSPEGTCELGLRMRGTPAPPTLFTSCCNNIFTILRVEMKNLLKRKKSG